MTRYVEICGYKDFFVLCKVYRHSNTCASKSTRSNRYQRRDVMG